MPRSFRKNKGDALVAPPLCLDYICTTCRNKRLHTRHRYCFDFVGVHSGRQCRGMRRQRIAILAGEAFDLQCPLDGLALERCFPAPTLGAYIRASARSLAGRVDRDVAIRLAHQPRQAPFGIYSPARNACTLRNMLGPGALSLLCHITNSIDRTTDEPNIIYYTSARLI